MVVKLAAYIENSALWCYGGDTVCMGGAVSKFIAHMTGEYSCDAMAINSLGAGLGSKTRQLLAH